MAPIALLGVQEGRFAWGLLGLVLFALVLVAVAVILAVVALRRSRRALSAVSAIVSGGFQPELAVEAIAREPAAEPPTRILPSEPELAPAGEELEAPAAEKPETVRADFSAAEPGAGEPAAPAFEAPPSSPRGGPAEGILCECGHTKGDHHRLTASKWMCLADVVPACQCRQFVPQRNETASLVRSLEHRDEFVRAVAASELRGRPEATEALLEALADQSPQVRREAVKALEDAPADATVRRALIDVIAQDLSPAVRQEAVRILAAFLGRAGDAGAA